MKLLHSMKTLNLSIFLTLSLSLFSTPFADAQSQKNSTYRTMIDKNKFVVGRGYLAYGHMLTSSPSLRRVAGKEIDAYYKVPVTQRANLRLKVLLPITDDLAHKYSFPTNMLMDSIIKPQKSLFIRYMNRLSKDAVWLDAGAGYANAQREYRQDGGKAKLVAAVFNRPKAGDSKFCTAALDQKLAQFEKKEGKRFVYLEGKGIESYSAKELQQKIGQKKVDVITDVYGPISYSKDLSGVIKQYGNMLKPGGKLFLHYYDNRLRIKGKRSRERHSLEAYLKSIPGLKVRRIDADGNRRSLIIERTKEKLGVPILKKPKVFDLTPPEMTFPSPLTNTTLKKNLVKLPQAVQ